MDSSMIYLIIGLASVILNVVLVFAILAIRDQSKIQSQHLAQISKDTYVTRQLTYLQAKKNIASVQVVKRKGKSSDAKAEEEVKVISFDEWIAGYSDSEIFKVERVQ